MDLFLFLLMAFALASGVVLTPLGFILLLIVGMKLWERKR